MNLSFERHKIELKLKALCPTPLADVLPGQNNQNKSGDTGAGYEDEMFYV